MRRIACIALVLLPMGATACGVRHDSYVPFATVDADPAWSPDVGRDGIYIVPRHGGPAVRLRRGPLSLPAWAPDGRHLAVVREEPDLTTAIYVMNADGSGLRRLSPPLRGSGDILSASETEPCWSPDGRDLVLEAGDGVIAAVPVAGGRLRRITALRGFQPAWSPDGGLVAFQSDGALWVARADGRGGLRRLAAEDVFAEGGNPSWAPDSRRLVFEVVHDRGRYTRRASSLSVVDVEGGDPQRLTFGGSTADDPAWRDGIVGKSTW
jgi:Tol biopolymer transport system component